MRRICKPRRFVCSGSSGLSSSTLYLLSHSLRCKKLSAGLLKEEQWERSNALRCRMIDWLIDWFSLLNLRVEPRLVACYIWDTYIWKGGWECRMACGPPSLSFSAAVESLPPWLAGRENSAWRHKAGEGGSTRDRWVRQCSNSKGREEAAMHAFA